MSDIAIKVENLSKQYRLGQIGTGTISHDLNRWWHQIRGKEDPYLKIGEANDRAVKGNSEYVWALQDINFEVKQGEVLGIIGKNGAGKSTLLKILSKVTSPTTGSIKAKGRIASLLEVGTGFHPEMTGRENIFMNGTIMGMNRHEIRAKLDEIVEFAGVAKYLDTPVKRYSSGMTVRLGFAIAAHLEPEILIVDEVLAVGDAEFQKKAIGKMQDVSKGEGRTVLFVSHNMASIRKLCKSGILLEQGKVSMSAPVEKVIAKHINETDLINTFQSEKREGNFIHSIKLNLDSKHGCIMMGEKMTLESELHIDEPMENAAFSYQIRDSEGNNIIHNLILSEEQTFGNTKGKVKLKNIIESIQLYPGKYSLSVFLADAKSKIGFDKVQEKIHFEVQRENSVRDYYWKQGSAIYYQENEWYTQT
ncbi:ABC transporter ATP-binding protein [Reichenbachiella ulvae]|uniref:ABC transporter ATP-binding protein n=1 Tax=Reichenbachiella ulvae TaxID=2980104 RepID=A0ABT3CZ06_9BACT|nr:ABC transporter ATP-binding protein [Reichenbachiella ulvae]MCV9388814.1 ABC transporter ATP-binding protein [Reichenbachiella ulvae]